MYRNFYDEPQIYKIPTKADHYDGIVQNRYIDNWVWNRFIDILIENLSSATSNILNPIKV